MSRLKKLLIPGLTLIGVCTLAKAEVPASYEMDGDIESRYLRQDGEWASITNWFEVSVSGCRSAIRTGSMGDPAVEYFEYVCDGTKSALLIKYYPPEVRGLTGRRRPINQANLIINPGSVPEYGFGLITPVWLACASSCFFQKNGSQIEPIFYMGPGFREHHLKVEANWSLAGTNPKLPEWMCDFTDGKAYKDENGVFQTEPVPTPFDKPTTNAVFSVLSWTKLGDLHLPSKWQVIQYKPNFTSQTLEVQKIDTAYMTAVRDGTSRDSFAIQAPEYTRVTDRTLEARGVPVAEFSYISTNGKILSLSEMSQQRNFMPILKEGVKRVLVPKKRSPLVVAVLILCFVAVAAVWKWRTAERV